MGNFFAGKLAALFLLVAHLLYPAVGSAQDTAADIVSRVQALRAARVADVSDYTLVREVDGREMITYYERKEQGGTVVFEPVGPLRLGLVSGAFDGTPLARYAPGGNVLEGLRDALIDAALDAGIAALSQQIGGAAAGQVASIVESLISPPPAGADDETRLGSLVDVDALKGALVDGALKAGMQMLASELLGLSASSGQSLLDAMRGKASPDQLLGELGDMVLPGQGGSSSAYGSSAGGMPAMGAAPAGDLTQAGINALTRIGGELITRAMVNATDTVLTQRSIGELDLYVAIGQLEERFRLQGTERLNGRDTWVLLADDLGGLVDENELRSGQFRVWVDRDLLVPLQAEISGKTRVEGSWKDIRITAVREAYQEVEGMLFPQRSVTSISGIGTVFSDSEYEQLQQKISEASKQYEQLPPQMRAMAEQMMQGQMAQLESVSGSGSMQVEALLVEARVNAGPPPELVEQLKNTFARSGQSGFSEAQ